MILQSTVTQTGKSTLKCLMYSACMGPNKSGEKNTDTTTHIQFFTHSFLS